MSGKAQRPNRSLRSRSRASKLSPVFGPITSSPSSSTWAGIFFAHRCSLNCAVVWSLRSDGCNRPINPLVTKAVLTQGPIRPLRRYELMASESCRHNSGNSSPQRISLPSARLCHAEATTGGRRVHPPRVVKLCPVSAPNHLRAMKGEHRGSNGYTLAPLEQRHTDRESFRFHHWNSGETGSLLPEQQQPAQGCQ